MPRSGVHPRTYSLAGRQILARNLKKWRTARKLSPERLAERTGLDGTFLGLIERARCDVSIDDLCLIAAALGIHPYRLLDDGHGDGDNEAARARVR